MSIIDYIKYKLETRQNSNNVNKKIEEDLDKLNTSSLGDAYNSNSNKTVIIKSTNVVKRVAVLTASLVALLGVLALAEIMDKHSFDDGDSSVATETQISAINKNNEYGYKLTEGEVLEIASKALIKIENNLVSNGATSMGEPGSSFYPEWFNPKMITAIAFIESSYRETNSDGSPLLGCEVTNHLGEIEQARGMCQVLPSTLEHINYWLKNTMQSDLLKRPCGP